MSIRRNESGQRFAVRVVNAAGTPQTGVQLDLSCKISKDGTDGVSLGDTLATQISATDFPGIYYFDLTQSETDASLVVLDPASTDALDLFDPPVIVFEPTTLASEGATLFSAVLAYFRTTIQPIVRRGITVTEFSGTGWLSRVAAKVRRWVDEPQSSAKFPPTTLLEMMRESLRELVTDIQIVAENQLLVRYLFTLSDTVQDYVLPPGVGQVYRIAQIDSASGTLAWEVYPGSPWSPFHPQWTLEDKILRFSSMDPGLDGEELEVLYVTNGDLSPHVGSIVGTAISADGKTITLAATPTDGTLDTRPNSYGGYVFRVLSSTDAGSNYVQERPVSSSSNTARTVTLRNALSPIPPAGATVVYELVPPLGSLFEDVLAVHVARAIVTSESNEKRLDILTQRYREKARALRLQMATIQQRHASRFDNRTYDNTDLSWRLV